MFPLRSGSRLAGIAIAASTGGPKALGVLRGYELEGNQRRFPNDVSKGPWGYMGAFRIQGDHSRLPVWIVQVSSRIGPPECTPANPYYADSQKGIH